jgi:hypothetical protein
MIALVTLRFVSIVRRVHLVRISLLLLLLSAAAAGDYFNY